MGRYHHIVSVLRPSTRLFTFSNFQLALTFEEFESILVQSLKMHHPFLRTNEEVTPPRISAALGISIKVVKLKLIVKGGLRGFPKKFLDAKFEKYEKIKDWDTFGALLALEIYGLVLFPNMDDFIAILAIEVFLIGNRVTYLLAYIHYSLCVKHNKKKVGTVLICGHLLSGWLMSHMPSQGPFTLKVLKWPQRLAPSLLMPSLGTREIGRLGL